MASMTVGTPKRPTTKTTWYLAAAGGAALALAVVVGIGTWQVVRHGRGTETPAISAAQTEPRATADAAPAPVPPARVAAPEMTYYLVGSQAQASDLQAMIDGDANRVRAETGEPPLNAVVVVVGSADDEARVGRMFSELDNMLLATGQPLPRVVDLRAPEVPHAPPVLPGEYPTITCSPTTGQCIG